MDWKCDITLIIDGFVTRNKSVWPRKWALESNPIQNEIRKPPMHILMTSLCKLSLNMQHWNDPKKETPRNEMEIPEEYLSDVIWHPSNERDVVVLKSDLKWGDISHSKDYIPNGGNGSKRRWSSDLIYWSRQPRIVRRLKFKVMHSRQFRAFVASVSRPTIYGSGHETVAFD